MFDEVKITRHITENYSEFKDDTLVEKKPVPNWPQLLGQRSADLINKEYNGKALKVLVVYGGVSLFCIKQLNHLRFSREKLTLRTPTISQNQRN